MSAPNEVLYPNMAKKAMAAQKEQTVYAIRWENVGCVSSPMSCHSFHLTPGQAMDFIDTMPAGAGRVIEIYKTNMPVDNLHGKSRALYHEIILASTRSSSHNGCFKGYVLEIPDRGLLSNDTLHQDLAELDLQPTEDLDWIIARAEESRPKIDFRIKPKTP